MTPSPLTRGGRDNRPLSGEPCRIVIGRITTPHVQSLTALLTYSAAQRSCHQLVVFSKSIILASEAKIGTFASTSRGCCRAQKISIVLDSSESIFSRSIRYHSLTLSRLIDDLRINNRRKGTGERRLPYSPLRG